MRAVHNLFQRVFFAIALILLGHTNVAVAATAYVSVFDDYFSPSTTSIHAGDTVVWIWGSDSDSHNVVSASKPLAFFFPSPDGGPGTVNDQDSANVRPSPFSFSNTFNATGSFPYECTPHIDEGMVGTITVASSPPIVSITNLITGQILAAPANLIIEASASESGGSIAKVQFLLNATVLTNCLTAPYAAVTNNLPVGTYTITAIASGANKLTATKSITINVIAPTPITTTAAAFASTGTFQFTYSTTPGLSYLVQVSSNLLTWTSLATNAASTNYQTFTDTNASSAAVFYRIQLALNP